MVHVQALILLNAKTTAIKNLPAGTTKPSKPGKMEVPLVRDQLFALTPNGNCN